MVFSEKRERPHIVFVSIGRDLRPTLLVDSERRKNAIKKLEFHCASRCRAHLRDHPYITSILQTRKLIEILKILVRHLLFSIATKPQGGFIGGPEKAMKPKQEPV